jgi:hypothetical protein
MVVADASIVSDRNPIAKRRLWQIGLIAIIVVTLAKSILWAFINPPLNAGDETAHLMYIMQLRNRGELPVYKFTPPPDCAPSLDSTPADPGAAKLISDSGYASLASWSAVPFEGFQAPLFYLTAALIALPVPRDDALATLYAARILSALLATAIVVIAAYAVRELTLRPELALAGAALISLIPTFGYYGGVATNDNMLNLFAAATALVALRILRTPSKMLVPGSLLLGAIQGGAILSKASGVALILVGVLTLVFAVVSTNPQEASETIQGWWPRLLYSLKSRAFWYRLLGLLALYSLALLMVAGWWLVRNLVVYGDLLGTANHFTYAPACWWGPTMVSQGIATWPRYLFSIALLTPFSFVASFGWGDENIGSTAYFALILPALLMASYLSIKWLQKNWHKLMPFQQMGLWVMGALGAVGVFLLLSVNFVLQYQPVGRFTYPALVPVVGFLSIGILLAGNNRKLNRAAFVVVVLCLSLLTIHGWLFAGTGYMATHAAQLGR